MRLIDADALKEDFKKRLSNAHKWLEKAKDEEIKIRANAVISYICEVIMTIDYAPTVEPSLNLENITEEEIEKFKILWQRANSKGLLAIKEERPQGEWIKWNFKTFGAFGDCEYKCSNCEKVYGGEYNFCPNCGASMRKTEGKT